MRRAVLLRPVILPALIALTIVVPATPAAAAAADGDRLVVRYAQGASATARGDAMRAAGARVLRRTDRSDVVRADASGAARLRRDPRVASVEADVPVRTAAAVPNDPNFGLLYGLRNTGQSIRGVAGVAGQDVGALRAWDVTRGAGATVAVLDTGTDTAGPDLAPNLWTNPGELPANGLDDDANGFVDDLNGWNLVASTGVLTDDNGHGTHVAGTIAAAADNGVGIAGVAPQSRLLTVKVLAADGSGWTSDVADGFRYAAEHGARVVNASLAGTNFSAYLRDAIAAHPGVLLVAAAGNEAVDVDTTPQYPCSYELANIVCVAAHDNTGALASFSNFGDVSVDLAAPGHDIASWLPGGTLGWMSGTSMAAPHVSGAATLAAAAFPTLGANAVRDALVRSARDGVALTGTTVASGALDAAALLADLGGAPPTVSAPAPVPEPTVAADPVVAPALPPAEVVPSPVTVAPTLEPLPIAPSPLAAPAPSIAVAPRAATVTLAVKQIVRTRRFGRPAVRIVGRASRAGVLVLRICRPRGAACRTWRGRAVRGPWRKVVTLTSRQRAGSFSVTARLVDARTGRTLARARRG